MLLPGRSLTFPVSFYFSPGSLTLLSWLPQMFKIWAAFLSVLPSRPQLMSPTPLNVVSVNTMPSETSFKHHVELVHSALKTFHAISQLDAPGPVKTAFDELVNITADFNKFMPTFTNCSFFQELPPLVHTALEDFLAKHPAFNKPANFSKIVGLNARAQDSIHIASRQGTYLSSFSLNLFTHIHHY